jgi:nicotinate-nucleotide pyrophosphorylase (carboxylating)
MIPEPPPPLLYEPLLRRALEEDLGTAGDRTTDAIVQASARTRGSLVARDAGQVAGLPPALAVFRLLDAEISAGVKRRDGEAVTAGGVIATIEGSARALLTGERTALNLLGRLCGIATATRRIVDAVAPYRTRVLSTRKTTPGLRALEKYAVRAGGGADHRYGLHDAVLIKDNHVAVAGGIPEAVQRVRERIGPFVPVEVEVDSLDQLQEALTAGVQAVLLDNMTPATLRDAVAMAAGRALTEASGRITAERAAEIAATGVDCISVGWLTHSAPALDIALDIDA